MAIQGISGAGMKPADIYGAKPETSPVGSPDKNEKSSETTMDTDKVDREIERLKERKRQLEQQKNMEEDEQKKAALDIQIRQVEMELMEKDNDNYRRQHAVIS